ncbi:MAG TPA: tetratricopeptide repeat protein [Rhodospirillaceae bacterium]|nr:tetratricopeptide repeat protein [Rhodospirillaceae bacterium]
MLKKQGKLGEALDYYRQGLALDDSDPQANYNLGLALWQQGRSAEAVPQLRRAVELNPFIPDGYNTLGLVEMELGAFDAAERAFRDAIAAYPGSLTAFLNLSSVLTQAGRTQDAITFLQWAIGLHGHAAIAGRLAPLLEDAGQLEEAGKILRAALEERPDDGDLRERLAALYMRKGRFLEALTQLQTAVRSNPERATAHMRIFALGQILGQPELALEHQSLALGITRVFTEKGADDRLPQLMILNAPGDWKANLPTDFIIRRDRWGAVHQYYLDPSRDPELIELPRVDAVLCAVAEPDLTRPELASAARLLERLGLPVINHPHCVAETCRDRVARLLADIPDLLVPVTLRLGPGDAAQRLADAMKEGLLQFPLLIRPVGTHAGDGMRLVETGPVLAEVLGNYGAGEVYVSQFVDYRNEDDHYRKYRVIVVDGHPYPFHLGLSRRWMVHYYNSDPADPAQMNREEEHFLADFPAVFNERLQTVLKEMHRRLRIEIFAVDCAITADGRLLLFEVDVGAVVHAMDDPRQFAHKHKYVPRIFDAIQAMIHGRIAQHRAGLIEGRAK